MSLLSCIQKWDYWLPAIFRLVSFNNLIKKSSSLLAVDSYSSNEEMQAKWTEASKSTSKSSFVYSLSPSYSVAEKKNEKQFLA